MPGKRTLLVEGPDDEHVLKHLCGTRDVGLLDNVTAYGGADQLLESFPVRLKLSEEGDIIGLVIDADADLTSRWQAIRDRLILAGYQIVPVEPVAAGTILDPPSATLLPRVGVWIMPDNQTKGILEDFLLFLVPPASWLFEHAKSSVAAIPADERRFSQLAEPKAIIHTWLAWQEEPGRPLGTAITARYLDPGLPGADVLVTWLKRLFFS